MKLIKLTLITPLLRGVALIICLVAPVSAEIITVGKGSGILWEGLPFNKTLSGPMMHSTLHTDYGLLSISNSRTGCMKLENLKLIGGYLALPLPDMPGVGLAPRATGRADYTLMSGALWHLAGTIGLPETKGNSTSESNINSSEGRAWCLAPESAFSYNYYSSSGKRTATLSGNWVLVSDGTQQTGESMLPTIYFGSYSIASGGSIVDTILPSAIKLRVSTLGCSVVTPLSVYFGTVARNTGVNVELSKLSQPLTVSCTQHSDHITANVNLQFRALSGLYEGEPSRLLLDQKGGYITGEIDNGLTGNGACNVTGGIRFDKTAIKVGSITNEQNSKVFHNQVTWRLCSGGSSLPRGEVTASAEMLVTFN